MADLALLAQLPQGAELVGERDRGVDAVQLQEADVVAAQPPQRLLDLVAQGLGAGVVVPLPAADRAMPTLVAISRSSG